VFIYFGNNWTVRVSGESWRAIDCEACDTHFEYPVVVEGVGSAHDPYSANERKAKSVATDRAREHLAAILDTTVVPMTCPGCGRYQRAMIDTIKRRKFPYPFRVRAWMKWAYALLTGVAIAIIVGMAVVPNFTSTPLAAGFFIVFPWALVSFVVPIFIVQALRRKFCDPYAGTTVQDRIEYALAHTVPVRPMAQPVLSPVFEEPERPRRATPIISPIIDE
jgi:hypothetical protein